MILNIVKSWKTSKLFKLFFQLHNLKSTSPECPSYVLEPVFQGDHQGLLQLHALHIQVKTVIN